MAVADFHGGFQAGVVAGISDAGYRMPVHPIDLELLANQIPGIADDDAVSCRIEIDDITRTRRTAGQPFALSDRKQLDALMFTEEIPGDIVNFATVKFAFTLLGTQKHLVIVAGNKTDFLTIHFVSHFKA